MGPFQRRHVELPSPSRKRRTVLLYEDNKENDDTESPSQGKRKVPIPYERNKDLEPPSHLPVVEMDIERVGHKCKYRCVDLNPTDVAKVTHCKLFSHKVVVLQQVIRHSIIIYVLQSDPLYKLGWKEVVMTPGADKCYHLTTQKCDNSDHVSIPVHRPQTLLQGSANETGLPITTVFLTMDACVDHIKRLKPLLTGDFKLARSLMFSHVPVSEYADCDCGFRDRLGPDL